MSETEHSSEPKVEAAKPSVGTRVLYYFMRGDLIWYPTGALLVNHWYQDTNESFVLLMGGMIVMILGYFLLRLGIYLRQNGREALLQRLKKLLPKKRLPSPYQPQFTLREKAKAIAGIVMIILFGGLMLLGVGGEMSGAGAGAIFVWLFN